jgi:pyrimidine operon attenuation protein/uracil phosphoribosyltransferase
MREKKILYGTEAIQAALMEMAAHIAGQGPGRPVLVGIRRGGVTMAERLGQLISIISGQSPDSGVIDINLYRDDWTLARSFPKVGRTEIGLSLEGRRVVLVDDVLYTGRTVRSALEALSEFGRASRVELAVLVDRGHREMPIQPDWLGFKVEAKEGELVEVAFGPAENQAEIFLLGPKDSQNQNSVPK